MATVDVVIATRDRPAALRRSLSALTRQTLPTFGVIVVDDDSKPPIASWLHAADFPTLDLTIITVDKHGGPAIARNEGIGHSDADYIAFVDDDVEAEPHLLERHLKIATGGDGAWLASVGPMSAPPSWEPQLWSLWEWRQLEAEYDRMIAGVYPGTWRQFHTGNAFVPRAALIAVSGFDPRFTRAEDIELALRLAKAGVAIRFTPGAVVWHSPVRSFRSWRQIATAYGRFDVAIDRVHPEMAWLDRVGAEGRNRHWLLRIARATPGMAYARPIVSAVAAGLSLALGASGLTGPALAALSFVYALDYDHGQRSALSDAEWFSSPPGRSRSRATAPRGPAAVEPEHADDLEPDEPEAAKVGRRPSRVERSAGPSGTAGG